MGIARKLNTILCSLHTLSRCHIHASGSLTATVGAQLGTDSVGKLSLQHATTRSNGWEKTDTYSFSEGGDAEVTAAAHSRKGHWWDRDYEDGSFNNQGSIEWQCKIREICFIGPWIDGAGSCSNTTSNASGDNQTGVIHSRYDDPVCNE